MKRLLLIIAIAAVAMSCEGPQGPPGPQGPGGVAQKVYETFTVRPNQWVKVYGDDGLFLYLEYVRDIAGFGTTAFEQGIYTTYLQRWDDNEVVIREGLGATFYYEEANGELWSQTVTADYNAVDRNNGQLGIKILNSNYNEGLPQGDMTFRFVAIW